MPRGRKLQRDIWAGMILYEIPIDPAPPLFGAVLALRTGLTRDQVSAGVAWLRDSFPGLPLVSSHKGYVWSTDPDDVARFKKWRGRTAMTVIRRCFSGDVIPLLRHTAPTQEPFITRQFERLLQDIDALLVTP